RFRSRFRKTFTGSLRLDPHLHGWARFGLSLLRHSQSRRYEGEGEQCSDPSISHNNLQKNLANATSADKRGEPSPKHFASSRFSTVASKRRSNQIRIDQLLVEQGLCESRTKAQALILAGEVYVNTQRIDKPSTFVAPNCQPEVRAAQRFVSRGGDKLDGALSDLELQVSGLVCVDVGASTGGFTDCLLQRGAPRVYAVDVGHGLLAYKLQND